MKKTLLCPITLFLTASAFAGDTLEQILSAYYPLSVGEKNCQAVIHKSEKYCMRILKSEVGETQSGKKRYVLVAGDNINATSHPSSGLVGIFVLSPSKDGGFDIEAVNAKIPLGLFGKSPKDWTFHQFSPNSWGYLTAIGYSGGGYTFSNFFILTNQGKSIQKSSIPYYKDNAGTCGEGLGQCESIDGKIKIDRSTVIKGFYPLVLTLNGLYKGKTYEKRKYRITHDGQKGYQTPANYPLN